MATIEDLGRAFKKEFPAYSDLSDLDAGRLAKIHGQGAYDNIPDAPSNALAVRQSTSLHQSPQGLNDPNFDIKLKTLWKELDPKMGGILASYRAWKLDGKTEFLSKSNEHQRQLLEQANMISEQVIRREKDRQELEMFYHQNQATLHQMRINLELMRDAAKEGLTIEGLEKKVLLETEQRWQFTREQYQAEMLEARIKLEHEQRMELETRQAQIELGKFHAMHTAELEKARMEHFLRMDELRTRADIETENDIKWSRERMRLAIIAESMQEEQRRIMVQDLVDDLYRQIGEICDDEKLSQETKERMMDDREAMIDDFKKEFKKLKIR